MPAVLEILKKNMFTLYLIRVPVYKNDMYVFTASGVQLSYMMVLLIVLFFCSRSGSFFIVHRVHHEIIVTMVIGLNSFQGQGH